MFRAEVASAEGSGSLRLVLRRMDAAHFSLQAADALGQSRWELRVAGADAVWIDSSARRYCRLDARRPVQLPQWVANVAIRDFAGLLTGDWPRETALADPVELSFPGAMPPGAMPRRLAGEREDGRWKQWTILEGDEPTLWWKRSGEEAVLSARQPAGQIRWRVSAHNASAAEPFSLLPEGAGAEVACHENALP
ncbi:MAG: hypothetical protein ABI639_07170 [Thermoanaerobaculia bacterium]